MPIYNPTGSLGYKIYSAIMNQSGVAAPVPVILQNTIGNIVWQYVGIGLYSGVLVGAFPANKCLAFVGSTGDFTGSDPDYYTAQLLVDSPNAIQLNAILNGGGVNQSQDDAISAVSIEVRVYP
jgi:hypothetical protein